MSNIIQDGTFLVPIQIGTQDIYQWTDWTNAGITTQNPAPPVPEGDYASMPVGADLFQDFSALTPGNYTLTFFVENQSPWEAKLVLAVQQFLGTPISELFAAGAAEELSLPASMTSFVKETFNFTITPNEQFIPQELTFSNSYDAPIPPITNLINQPGTIINIADVSLTLTLPPPVVSPNFTDATFGQQDIVPAPGVLGNDQPGTTGDGTALEIGGVRPQRLLAGADRWRAGIPVRSRSRACHYRRRCEPEAEDPPLAATSASAAICSSGGSPENWPSLR